MGLVVAAINPMRNTPYGCFNGYRLRGKSEHGQRLTCHLYSAFWLQTESDSCENVRFALVFKGYPTVINKKSSV
jgi:hypothetical protein